LAPPNETPEIIASQQPPGSLGPPRLRRIAITLSWRTAEGEPSAPLRLVAWVAGREEAPP